MKNGIKVFIVAVVAIATNFGLQAAFWGGCGNVNGQCGPQNNNHCGYYQPGNCNHQNTNCANPWGCRGVNSNAPTDTTKH